MANYIFGVVENRGILSESSILETFPEAFFYSLGNGFFFRVSAGGSNDEGFSKGVKVDKKNKEVVFCNGGEDKRLHNFVDGAYIEQNIDGGAVKISADKFGIFPVFYSKSNGLFVASDSIMLICYIRKMCGMSNSIDEDEFSSRSWMNAVTYSLVSEYTPVEEVFYLLPGHSVSVLYADQEMSLEVRKEISLIPDFATDDVVYSDLLESEAKDFLGIIEGLSRNVSLSLSVSGGIDSRALICAAEKINNKQDGEGGHKVSINCKKNDTPDYDVVESISKKYSIPLNEKNIDIENLDLESKVYRIDKVSQWAMANVGCYDPLYATGRYYKSTKNISLGGHGAAAFKGSYGWRPVESIGKSSLPESVYIKFQKQVAKSLPSIATSEVFNFSSEVHWLYYRNPLHGSRFMISSLVALRPLMMQSLMSVAYSFHHEGKKLNKYKISKDLLLKINSKLALEPYDKGSKNISQDYAERAKKEIGGDEYSYKVYSVIGRPEDIKSGPLRGAMEVAHFYGFYGDDFYSTFASNLEFLKSAAVGNGVVEAFEDLVANVNNISLKGYTRGAALGKVLSLMLTK